MNFGGSGALSRRLGIHDSESQESKTEDYSPHTPARMRALLSLPEVDECLGKPTLKADAAGDEAPPQRVTPPRQITCRASPAAARTMLSPCPLARGRPH